LAERVSVGVVGKGGSGGGGGSVTV